MKDMEAAETTGALAALELVLAHHAIRVVFAFLGLKDRSWQIFELTLAHLPTLFVISGRLECVVLVESRNFDHFQDLLPLDLLLFYCVSEHMVR